MTPRELDFLRTQHPFDQLSEEEMTLVGQSMATQDFAKGQRILELGGPISQCLHVVAEGEVALERDGAVVKVLEQGECFGFPSIINQTPPAFHAVAQGETTVHCLPAPVFQQLLGNSLFAEYFLKDLGQRLQQVARQGVASVGGELTTPLGDLDMRPLVEIAPDVTVEKAAQAMRQAREDVCLVSANPPGIITDHDFQVKVLAEGVGAGYTRGPRHDPAGQDPAR